MCSICVASIPLPLKFWLETFRIQYPTVRLNGISMFRKWSEHLITDSGKKNILRKRLIAVYLRHSSAFSLSLPLCIIQFQLCPVPSPPRVSYQISKPLTKNRHFNESSAACCETRQFMHALAICFEPMAFWIEVHKHKHKQANPLQTTDLFLANSRCFGANHVGVRSPGLPLGLLIPGPWVVLK